MKPNPHPVPSSVRKRFQDFFDRGNTTEGLGRSVYGGLWEKVSDFVFRIQDLRATTDEDPNEYPQTIINMSEEDVDLYLYDVGPGSAASLWFTDSGNWFAIGVDQHPVDCNCDVDTKCTRWNGSNITGWTTYTFESGGRNRFTVADGQYCQTNVSGYNATNYRFAGVFYRTQCRRYAPGGQCMEWSGYDIVRYTVSEYGNPNYRTTCNTNFATRYNSPNFTTNRNINGYNANLCNTWIEYTKNCETCYPQFIRLLQSINGTVSTVAKTLVSKAVSIVKSPNETLDLYVQDSPIVEFVRSFILRIRGNQISATLYSDGGAADSIDFDEENKFVYSPTGANVTPKYGIMITPSEYDQTNFVGGFQVIRDDY